MLARHEALAVIPLAAATELPGCLAALDRRRRLGVAGPAPAPAPAARALLPHCTRGAPLATRQANVLSDICTGLADVAALALDAAGQRRLRDYLGDADASRVIAFFAAGPAPPHGYA